MPEPYYELGFLYQRMGRMDEAVQLYEKACQLKPLAVNMAAIWNNYSVVLKALAKPQEALMCLQKALQCDPGFSMAYHNMGLLFYEDRQMQNAIDHLYKAVQLDPNNMAAQCALGTALVCVGKTDEALKVLACCKLAEVGFGDRIRAALALPAVYQSNEEIDFWRNRFETGLRDLQAIPFKTDNLLALVGQTNFFLTYHGDKNNMALQKKVGEFFANITILPSYKLGARNKKPKIGFISSFFNPKHTIGNVFPGIIEHLSRDLFDVCVFSVGYPDQLGISTPYQSITLPIKCIFR